MLFAIIADMKKEIKVLVAFIGLALLAMLFIILKPTHPEDPSAIKAKAWGVFEQYVTAAKAHDLAAVTSLSYQISATCKDPKQQTNCFKAMDTVASTTKSFKESDFTTVLFDAKQIILLTPWHEEETDIAFGEARSEIYFTRDSKGVPKILFFTQPEEIVFLFKGKNEAKATWVKSLTPRIKDTDEDAQADEVENCLYPGVDKTCIKTDPTKKDTNGNGWWDSTESFFYTNTPK